MSEETKINDGGPAFPKSVSLHMPKQDGMSLRDYFAAKAMASFIHPTDSLDANGAAKAAYEYADAMLKAREQQ